MKETKIEKQIIGNSTMKGQLARALQLFSNTLEDNHPLLLNVKDLEITLESSLLSYNISNSPEMS